MSRDVFQGVSLALSVVMLVLIARKVRRGQSTWQQLAPFALIALSTGLFYMAVLTDLMGPASSDSSSILRLSTQIALFLYIVYMRPTGKPDDH